MDGQDRRVRRTQALLAKALIELALEKRYEAITIRDITERADVGYATFFRHYTDKDALLADVLEVFLNELIDLLDVGAAFSEPEQAGKLIFRYVEERNQLCRVLLNVHGSAPLLRRIREQGTAAALARNTPRADSPVPPDVAANHLVASSVALIQWWLEHDMPYPVERMSEIYRDLIVRPTHSIAFE